jgi:hypothetical protein
MHSERSLKLILAAASVALVSGTLGALAYFSRPTPPDGDAVLGGPQLVLFELDDCGWCQSFRRKAGRQYLEGEHADKAALRYISIEDGPPPKRYRMNSYRQTPMLVLFDAYGREVERVTSELKDGAAVETLVRRNLKRMPKS